MRSKYDGTQKQKDTIARYTKTNREEIREYHRWHHRHAKYGLTKEACLVILTKQDFKCACCREPLGLNDRFTIDHDHQCCDSIKTCGRCVRGILCMNCNAGLGNFKDSLDLLLKAVEYLRRADGFCRI